MKTTDLKLVYTNPIIGRCIHCDARNLCGLISRFECKASISQHYIDIKTERKLKLQKINEGR